MKSVPVSGFIWESGSSGVKDGRVWRSVWVHYTGRHSYIFSLVSSFHSCGWLIEIFVLCSSLLEVHTDRITLECPPLTPNGFKNSICVSYLKYEDKFLHIPSFELRGLLIFSPLTFSLWILKDVSLWIPVLHTKIRQSIKPASLTSLRAIFSPLSRPPIKSGFAQPMVWDLEHLASILSLDDCAKIH